MTKDSVIIESPVNEVGTSGIIKKTWSNPVVLTGTLLPEINRIKQSENGIFEEVEYRFFYKGKHSALKKGNRATARGEVLYIIRTLDYGKVVEVLLSKDIPSGGKIG